MVNWNSINAIKYAISYNPDIICLQEVNKKWLEFIKKNSIFNYSYEIESENNWTIFSYLIVMSKYIIKNEWWYDHYIKENNSSIWKKIWFIKKFFWTDEISKSLFVDVESNIWKIKVHNLHLTWDTWPKIRIRQFSKFLKQANPKENEIICWDLNTCSSLVHNFIPWLLLWTKVDELLFTKERSIFNDFFKKLNLINPFVGLRTTIYPIYKQIDYILINKKFKIKNKECINDRHWSDHKMLLLEINK